MVYARVGLTGLTFLGFLTKGFFFFAASLLLGLAFGLALALVAAAFLVPVFALVFLAAPAVDFLAALVFFFAAAAAAGANERLGVPLRNVRRVKSGNTIGVVATRACATPRTTDDVPKR